MGLLPTNEETQKEENAGLSKSIFKYLRYWKWFLASIVVCTALAVVYLKMASPAYEVKAKILLESSNEDKMSPIQDFGLFNIKNNTDNELEVLNTSYLMELAVRKMEIYAQYYEIGKYKNRELYGADCPISVRLPKETLDTLRGKYNFEVEVRTNGTYEFTGKYGDGYFRVSAAKSDSLVELPYGLIYFSPGIFKPAQAMRVLVTIESPSKIADRLLGKNGYSPCFSNDGLW